jgi:hypothetical protein
MPIGRVNKGGVKGCEGFAGYRRYARAGERRKSEITSPAFTAFAVRDQPTRVWTAKSQCSQWGAPQRGEWVSTRLARHSKCEAKLDQAPNCLRTRWAIVLHFDPRIEGGQVIGLKPHPDQRAFSSRRRASLLFL